MKLMLGKEEIKDLPGHIFGLYSDGKFICCITIMEDQVYIANSFKKLTITDEAEGKVLIGNKHYTEELKSGS